MTPYCIVWDAIDKTYTKPGDTFPILYPNKSFLEVINFADPIGSVDPDSGNYPEPYKGCGDELSHRIQEVLKEYYGNNWQDNPNAKVIIIAHSMGGVATREALKEKPELIPHVSKIITLNTPHLGTINANLGMRDWMLLTFFVWHPIVPPLKVFVEKIIPDNLRLPDWLANSIKIDLQKHSIIIGGKFVLTLHGDKIAEIIIEHLPSFVYEIPYLGEFFTAFALFEGIGAPLIIEMWRKMKITNGAIPDLAEGSTFIRNLGTYGAGKIPFVSVMGRGFYDDDKYLFKKSKLAVTPSDIGKGLNRGIGLPLTAFYWIKSIFEPKPFLEWAIKSTISEVMWEWWNSDSDFWVRWGCQSVNHVSTEFNAEEIQLWGMFHGRITREPNIILKALEDRPFIDSVILIQKIKDSTGNIIKIDTLFLSENKIDTIIADLKNTKFRIEGVLKNVYFLAQTDFNLLINGLGSRFKYPDNLGYQNRRFFDTTSLNNFLGAGMNLVQIKAKNIVGEEFTRNYKLWVVPAGWFCMQENPEYRKVLPTINTEDTFKIRLIKLGTSDSLERIAWDTLKINFVRLIKDTSGNYTPNPIDTSLILIPKNYYNYQDVEGNDIECSQNRNYLTCPGKRLLLPFTNLKQIIQEKFPDISPDTFEGVINIFYKVNDYYKTFKSFFQFYVDKKPPEIKIIGPKGSFSINRDTTLPVIIKAKDNLQSECMTPDSLLIEIKDKNNNMIYKKKFDTPGFYYYGDLFFHNIPKYIFQNLNDGIYRIFVKITDRAGNFDTLTKKFKVDNTPPEVILVEKMDSILNTKKNFLGIKFKVNEWAKAKLILFKNNEIKYEKEINALRENYYEPQPMNNDFEFVNSFVIMKNEIIEDGIYTAKLEVRDSAGNVITLNTNDLTGNAYLRIDRKPPEMKDIYIQPLVVDDNDNLNLYFKVSQKKDDNDNKKGAKVNVYIDEDSINTFILKPEDDTLNIQTYFRINSSLTDGKHNINLIARDPFGNEKRSSLIFFKKTYGTEITFPDRDTLKRGTVVIKGRASDPDIFDEIPFKNFEIYWTRIINAQVNPENIDTTIWKKNFIKVREDLRRENELLNYGFKEVIENGILATFDIQNIFRDDRKPQPLTLPRIKILLISRSEKDGIKLSAFDTTTMYISNEIAQNPDIDIYLSVKKIREREEEVSPLSNDTLILNLTKGDTLLAKYSLKNVPSNIYFQVLSKSGDILKSEMDADIYPINGIPSLLDKNGFYLFSDNPDEINICYRGDSTQFGGLEIKAEKIFDIDSVSVDSGFVVSSYMNTVNIMAIKSFERNQQIKIKGRGPFKISNSYSKIYLGKNKLLTEGNIYVGSKLHKWDGKIFPSNTIVPPGIYRIKFIAYGKDGSGYAEKERFVKVKSKFEIDTIYVEPKEITLYDPNVSKVSLYFKCNMDLKADIFVVDSYGKVIDTVCLDKKFYGRTITHSVLWNAYKSPIIVSGNYCFKLKLKALMSDRDTLCYSPYFSVINVPVEYDTTSIYIPDKYAEGNGFLNGEKIYDAKPEYLFNLKANGILYNRVPYTLTITRKSKKLPLELIWKTEYFTKTKKFLPREFKYICSISKGGSWVPDSLGSYKIIGLNQDSTKIDSFQLTLSKGLLCVFNTLNILNNCNDTPPCEEGLYFAQVIESVNCGSKKCYRATAKYRFNSLNVVKLKIYKEKYPIGFIIYDSLLSNLTDSSKIILIDTGAIYKDYSNFFPSSDSKRYFSSIPKYPKAEPFTDVNELTYFNPYTKDSVTLSNLGSVSLSWDILKIKGDTYAIVILNNINNNKLDTLIKVRKIKKYDIYVFTELNNTNKIIHLSNKIPCKVLLNISNKPVNTWRVRFIVKYKNQKIDSLKSKIIKISNEISDTSLINPSQFITLITRSSNFFRELQFKMKSIPEFVEMKRISGMLSQGNKEDTIYLDQLGWNGSDVLVNYNYTLNPGARNSIKDTFLEIPNKGRAVILKLKSNSFYSNWNSNMDSLLTNGELFTKKPLTFENIFPDYGYVSGALISQKYKENFRKNIPQRLKKKPTQMFHFDSCGTQGMFNEPPEEEPGVPPGHGGGRINPPPVDTCIVSNPDLDIQNYVAQIFYINKKTHHDLVIGENSFKKHGKGNGAMDSLRPLIKLTYHPREFIPLRGKLKQYQKYKIYISRENKIYPQHDSIRSRPLNKDTLFGFIECSEIGEKIKVLLYEYDNSGDLKLIRYREFQIGDLFDPQDNNFLTAKSPYARAVIQFSKNSFNFKTLTGICPIYPDSIYLEGDEPYIGGNFGPIFFLKPRGAKFYHPNKPTLYYYFTPEEITKYNIDLNNIKIYAIKENGALIPLNTTIHQEEGKITLSVMADSFPGDSSPYFVALDRRETKDGRIIITRERIHNDTIKISGKYIPYRSEKGGNVIFLGYSQKIKNIYNLLYNRINRKFYISKSSNIGTKDGNFTLKIPLDKLLENRYEDTIYYYIIPCDTIPPLREKSDTLIRDDSFILRGIRKYFLNFPVASGKIEIGIPSITILPPLNPSTGIEIGKLKFFLNKKGKIFYTLYNLNGDIIEHFEFNVLPYDTITVIWDGKINNLPAEEGEYIYTLKGLSENGRYSDVKTGYWQVKWNYYAVILSPEEGERFIPGNNINLRAKVIGFNKPLKWEMITQKTRIIGIQEDTLTSINFTIPDTIFERIIFKATPLPEGSPDYTSIYPLIYNYLVAINVDTPKVIKNQRTYISSKTKISFKTIPEDNSPKPAERYKIYYKINENPYKLYENPFTINGEDGKYHISYYLVSNRGITSGEKDLYLDNSPPISQLIPPVPFINKEESIIFKDGKIQIKALDPIGVKKILYRIGSEEIVPNWKIYKGPFEIKKRNFTVEFFSVDSLSNKENVKAINFIKDTIPPSISILIKKPSWNNRNISTKTPISILSIDEDAGVLNVFYSIDDSINYSPYNKEFFLQGEEGIHRIYVKSEDKLGNVIKINKSLYLDKTPPKANIFILGTHLDSILGPLSRIGFEILPDSTPSYVIYKLDENEPETYTDPFIPPLINGLHQIKYYAEDSVLNRGGLKFFKFYVDAQKPEITILFHPFSIFKNSIFYIGDSFKIIIKTNDEFTGIDSSIFKIDDISRIRFIDSLEYRLRGSGFHKLKVLSYDRVVNKKDTSINIFIDSYPPTIKLKIGNPQYISDKIYISSITPCSLKAKDNETYVKNITYKINSDSFIINASSCKFNLQGKDGIYLIKYYSKDTFNNKSFTETEFLYLDNTPPSLSLEIPSPFIRKNDTIYYKTGFFSIFASDTGSGLKNIYYIINPRETIEWMEYTGPFNVELNKFILGIKAADNLSNMSAPKYYIIVKDNKPPKGEFLIGKPRWHNNISNKTLISINFKDSLSGVDTVFYSIDDSLNFSIYTESFNIQEEGRHKVYAKAKDKLGNISGLIKRSLYVDNTPPKCSLVIEGPHKDTIFGKKTFISFIISEDSTFSFVKYKFDDDTFNLYTKPFNPILSHGHHFLSYFAQDSVLNISEITTIKFFEDTIPPIITFKVDSPFYIFEGTTFISDSSKIHIYALDKNAGVESSFVYEPINTFFTDSIIFKGNILQSGENTIQVISKDFVKNERDSSFYVFLDDNPPQVFYKIGEPKRRVGDTIQVLPWTPETLFVEDKESGERGIFYQIKTRGNTISGFVENYFFIPPLSSPGFYTVKFSGVDNVLNKSDTMKIFIRVIEPLPSIVKITFPYDSLIVNRNFSVRGYAYRLSKWRLMYGIGIEPSNYILLKEKNYEVFDSLTILDTFPSIFLNDGIYTLKLEGITWWGDTNFHKRILYKGKFRKFLKTDVPYAGDIDGNKEILYYVERASPVTRDTFQIRKYIITDSFNLVREDTILAPSMKPCDISFFPDDKVYILSNLETSLEGSVIKYKNGIKNVYRLSPKPLRCEPMGNKLTILMHNEIDFEHFLILDTSNLQGEMFGEFYFGIRDFSVKDSYYFYIKSNNKIYKLKIKRNSPEDSIKVDITPIRIKVNEKGIIWISSDNGIIASYSPFKEKIFEQNLNSQIFSFYIKSRYLFVNEKPFELPNYYLTLYTYDMGIPKFLEVFSKSKNEDEIKIGEIIPFPSPYNPKKGFLNISFYLSTDCEGEALIYTLSEKLVRRIKFFGRRGENNIMWDGKNEAGIDVRSGIYVIFIRVKNGIFKEEKYTKFLVINK
ncbi:MAG: hypothetical protein ABIN20_00935 [candidate division WOR-3 bacterium]